jgi:hypothetical protein
MKKVNLFIEPGLPDWKKVPTGTKFTGTIENVKCTGRIFKNDKIYLCQSIKNGSTAPNKLRFLYSWVIDEGTVDDLKLNDVKITSLTLDPKFKVPKLSKTTKLGSYTVKYFPGKDAYITVGCTTVTKKQIERILEELSPKKKTVKTTKK